MFFIILALIGAALGSGSFAVNIANLYPPFAAKLARMSYKMNPDLIPQTEQIIRGAIKGEYDEDAYTDLMMQAGFSDETSAKLLRSARQLLSAYDYVALWRRELITEEDLTTYLNEAGFQESYHDIVKKATLYYPNAQDLVRFAVREVFSPEIASQYGLFEDLPEEFLKQSAKAGLSEEMATWYWGAHWQLPSPNQGYEMLHRGIITEEQLSTLLRAADFMPNWRKPLMDISYNVITRVDVRRMYQDGIYTEAQVFDTYKKMGYNDTDARDLSNWTIKRYSPKNNSVSDLPDIVERDDGEILPSQSLIVRSYEKGLITKEQAVAQLADLNYSHKASSMILDLSDEKLRQEIIDIQADAYAESYREGRSTLDEFRTQLTALGVQSKYLELIVNRELAQAKRREKSPTKADLEAWLKKGIIDVNYYIGKMRDFGYIDQDIQYYLMEIQYDVGPEEES